MLDLEQAGVLTSKYKRRFQAFTVDVQAELNLEILEHMDGIESEDWSRGGRVGTSGRNISDSRTKNDPARTRRRPTKHKDLALNK